MTGRESVDSQADRADDRAALGQRELLPSAVREAALDPLASVGFRVRARNDRDPALNFLVLTRRGDGRHVVERPRPQDEVAVA